MSESNMPTQWAITFTASGTVGKGTGPDPETLAEENAE